MRSRLWVQMTLAWYGRGGPDHLEEMLRREARGQHEWDSLESAGRFLAYTKGAKPYRSRAPVPTDAVWVDKCAERWPVTGEWFYSPMWYLLDNRVSLQTLHAFVKQLPVRYQDALLTTDDEEDLHFALGVVSWPFLTELSYPLGSWSLGALACAMRRLDLAGDTPGARKCAVGLVWAMNEVAPVLPPRAAQVLRETASWLRTQLGTPRFLAPTGLSVSEAEIDSFAAARSKHLGRYEFPRPLPKLWEFGWGQSCTSPAASFRCPYRC